MVNTHNVVHTLVPEVHISIRKNRLKNYGNKVYLKDRQNFQIELFNPCDTNVLAKIYLNGKNIGKTGIVLRPGERVFLERYLDQARKFEFQTYEVEDGNSNVEEAIKNNGVVEVSFFNEDTWRNLNEPLIYDYKSKWDNQVFYSDSGTSIDNPCTPFTFTSSTDMNIGSKMSNPQGFNQKSVRKLKKGLNLNKETGRIEMGKASKQKFTTVDLEFSQISFAWQKIQLLPLSDREKAPQTHKTRSYCPFCGYRLRKHDANFCEDCGQSLR